MQHLVQDLHVRLFCFSSQLSSIKLFIMKNIKLFTFTLLIGLLFLADQAVAQNFPKMDKSPHDISYYPRRSADKVMRVLYARPQKKGRVIFGDLEPFGKVWRTGANEATEISFYKDVKLGKQTIKAGTYALFTIPGKESWTVILNKDLHMWGAYNYNESNDVLRHVVPVEKTRTPIEAFSIYFEKSDNGAHMIMGWDDTVVRVPFEFN